MKEHRWLPKALPHCGFGGGLEHSVRINEPILYRAGKKSMLFLAVIACSGTSSTLLTADFIRGDEGDDAFGAPAQGEMKISMHSFRPHLLGGEILFIVFTTDPCPCTVTVTVLSALSSLVTLLPSPSTPSEKCLFVLHCRVHSTLSGPRESIAERNDGVQMVPTVVASRFRQT